VLYGTCENYIYAVILSKCDKKQSVMLHPINN